MRPTWLTVACAAALGCAAGVLATIAARSDPTARPKSPPSEPGDRRGGADADDLGDSPPRSRVRAPDSVQSAPEPTAKERAAISAAARRREVEGWVSDLARARKTRNRQLLDQSLRHLLYSEEVQAADAVEELVADLEFEFPESGHALWFEHALQRKKSIQPSATMAAAARVRYERDSARPSRSWDAHGWLKLAAAHGEAADLEWIAAQYDLAKERRDEAVVALAFARPDLARDALLKEARRQPRARAFDRAMEVLAARAPAEAFAVFEETLRAGELPGDPAGAADLLARWAATAPTERIPQVRSRIAAMASSLPARSIVAPIQALASRGEDTREFEHVISSIGRELRRLVDEQKQADGTGPYYAIEYHEVAQTPENLAALQYAIDTLGEDRTRGCRQVLDRIRERSSWK